ncbi:unnamed protein product [Vitrella brassicaformis CCMP3155]|uniref:TLDc domain-containing protein n=1 Tax=Vitrella brassicaformis (strain CCMP3155) TaxID=1169540 RepID=A0A0G4EVX3_VITBC|nr:unnamed protein product [Vitrella brassicaformis CCMP3155]|eukprot:CEM02465.1 unnamed protein product [Vitrella brassicaformis CCMP3155]
MRLLHLAVRLLRVTHEAAGVQQLFNTTVAAQTPFLAKKWLSVFDALSSAKDALCDVEDGVRGTIRPIGWDKPPPPADSADGLPPVSQAAAGVQQLFNNTVAAQTPFLAKKWLSVFTALSSAKDALRDVEGGIKGTIRPIGWAKPRQPTDLADGLPPEVCRDVIYRCLSIDEAVCSARPISRAYGTQLVDEVFVLRHIDSHLTDNKLTGLIDVHRTAADTADAAAPTPAVVPPPTCADEEELLGVSEMYGVLEDMYPNIVANDVMQTILEMIGKEQPKMTCLFKSSLHGSSYGNLAQRVVGRRGLLFVIKCDDTNTIAVFADTQLHLPADPTSVLGFDCPVSLFSVCGAFKEGITKIEVPQDEQHVTVAGIQGAVTNIHGVPWGKVCIARGRLWLGCGKDGPTDDLLNCCQGVEKKELPASREFVGKTISCWPNKVSLCGVETHCSTAQRVEVFQVLSAVPADPILTESDLRALVDLTGMTDATPQLLYKGERDG